MKNYRIHFVRHGMTQENKDGKFLGSRTDAHLCTEGMRELIDLRETYEYPPVGIVYTSPMSRCIETCGIVYPEREIMTVPELREMDFGDFEGKKMEEMGDSEEFKAWLANAMEFAPPNGESGHEFLQRVIQGFKFIYDDMVANEIYDVAVVTHGGVIMSLLSAIGLPRKQLHEWIVDHGRGYTCFVNAQLWGRDGLVEVAGYMPHGADRAHVDLV